MKKLWAVLLTVAMLLSVLACGDDKSRRDREDEDDVDVAGVWMYRELEEYLILYADGTWEKISAGADKIAMGEYTATEKRVRLKAEGEVYETLYWDDEEGDPLPDGTLRGSECWVYYCFALDSQAYRQFLESMDGTDDLLSATPYFVEQGYEINYELDEGGIYLKNGGYALSQDNKEYGRVPMTVTLTRNSFQDTLDGYVEIEFTKTVYFDRSDYPAFMFNKKFIIGQSTNLYDYYTGYWLRDTVHHGDTTKGENYYYYEYQSMGRTIHLEFNYDINWTRQTDTSYLLEQHYFVRMPADYDGIIVATPEAYPNYDSYLAAQSDPGDELRVVPDWAARNALLCRIHTGASVG